MKIDNEGGACNSLHVSPTVAATRFASAADASAVIESNVGANLPSAMGDEGTVDMRQTKAVQSQINEN